MIGHSYKDAVINYVCIRIYLDNSNRDPCHLLQALSDDVD